MSIIVEALRWYAAEAESLARHMKETLLKDREHTQAVLASLTVLSLDAGKRARAALAALDAQQGVNPELPKERIEAAAYSLGMRYAIRVQPVAESVAWLLESKFQGQPKPSWWNGNQFTTNANEAVRFFRREDAELVAARMHMVRATEHKWI